MNLSVCSKEKNMYCNYFKIIEIIKFMKLNRCVHKNVKHRDDKYIGSTNF